MIRTLRHPELEQAKLGCDTARLPAHLRPLFVELAPDPEAKLFADRVVGAPRALGRLFARRVLGGFFSDFDLNGLLGTYPLFLLGEAAWRLLLSDLLPASPRRLLDVGAGEGGVTKRMAPLFDEVATSETSHFMAKRLRSLGFEVHERDVTSGLPGRYETVSLLNVLDRTARPLTLLDSVHAGLTDGGLLVIALVLPCRPFYYESGTSREPLELIKSSSDDWESALGEFVETALEPHGFEVCRVARAPYISGGDAKHPLFVLDDAILVCRKRSR